MVLICGIDRQYYFVLSQCTRLTGRKRVVDFLLVLIELFFAKCYGRGTTSEYRFKIGDFVPTVAG